MYAVAHNMGIIRSFVDKGKTGTTIEFRKGLQERIRRAKHTVDCERETSLEIIGPVGASGSKLWA